LARKHNKSTTTLSRKHISCVFEEKLPNIMADGPTFAAHLTALGFNNVARIALVAQGLQNTQHILTLMIKDLEKLVTHCQNEVHNMARHAAIPCPVFPFLAMKRLHTFYHWAIYQESRGQPTSPSWTVPSPLYVEMNKQDH
jgi:hypothetical protein